MYGRNTLRISNIKVDHNFKTQKTHNTNRYTVDKSAADKLLGELIVGHAKVEMNLIHK